MDLGGRVKGKRSGREIEEMNKNVEMDVEEITWVGWSTECHNHRTNNI